MNIILDIGNTSCKIAFFEGLEQKKLLRVTDPDEIVPAIRGEKIDTVVCSSVRHRSRVLLSQLKQLASRVIEFDLKYVRKQLEAGNQFFAPLENMPEGMGADRMAAILEASIELPSSDILLFDFGTATTVEFIAAGGHYQGGTISLGLNTRYRALSHFTRKIPLCSPNTILDKMSINEISTVGYDLDTALAAGNILGIKFEIEGYIAAHPQREVVFTGGDAAVFAEGVSKKVRVIDNLVLLGLARIAIAQTI